MAKKLGWILFTGLALGGVAISEHAPWFHRSGPLEGSP
jgi:Ni/Fe-hydrogenase subunit HybB-like protein